MVTDQDQQDRAYIKIVYDRIKEALYTVVEVLPDHVLKTSRSVLYMYQATLQLTSIVGRLAGVRREDTIEHLRKTMYYDDNNNENGTGAN